MPEEVGPEVDVETGRLSSTVLHVVDDFLTRLDREALLEPAALGRLGRVLREETAPTPEKIGTAVWGPNEDGAE